MIYDTIPIKTLCRLLDDESKLGDYPNISNEDWESIKEEYIQLHPTKENTELISELSMVIKQNIEANKTEAVIKFLMQFIGDAEPYFKAAGIKYTGDPETDVRYLQSLLNKAVQKKNIHEARYNQLHDKIQENKKNEKPEPLSMAKINEALASMNMAGANIGSFNEVTAGEYDAYTEVLKKAAKNGK